MWTLTRVTRRTPTCATCRIEHTCTLSLVFLVWSFITHHVAQGRSRVCHTISIPSMMSVSLWVARLLLSPHPVFLLPLLVHLLDVRLRLWLRDKQLARLRQRDLRQLGRFLTAYRFWAPTPRSSSTTRSSMTRSSASSLTSRIPSVTLPLRQTTTWMTRHSASYWQKYTESTPITTVRKV